MKVPSLGGGIKSGSGRGRRLALADLLSASLPLSAPPFWPVLSDGEFLSERRRVTITEGW